MTVLVLRTCEKDMTSHKDFLWPKEGPVQCDDWDSKPRNCGGGLHGLLWGEGAGQLLNWQHDAKWLVVEVAKDVIAASNGKVRFPRGWVVFCGNQFDATEYIQLHGGVGRVIVGHTIHVGYKDTAIVGYHGTAIAGNYGIAITGDSGIATAGDRGTAIAKGAGRAIAGHDGIAIVGSYGTAITGNVGSATAGYEGTAIVGDRGVASVRSAGIVKAGYDGVLQNTFWQGNKRRIVTAYVGENGIKPDIPYRLNVDEFEEVT